MHIRTKVTSASRVSALRVQRQSTQTARILRLADYLIECRDAPIYAWVYSLIVAVCV